MDKIKNAFTLKNAPVMVGPSIGIVAGSLLGSAIKPSIETLAVLRNLAAGLVLAAVSTELAPQVAEAHFYRERISVIAGILIGLGLMITLRTIFSQKNEEKMSIEVVVSIAIDFFIDSLLIGIALSSLTGGTSSMIMAIALGIEMFILSMTTTSQMHAANSSYLYIMTVTATFVMSTIVGLFSGMFAANMLKGTPMMYMLMAFGVSALIWLVTEDLIVKSKYLDSRLAASMLFLGFMTVLVIGWFGHAH